MLLKKTILALATTVAFYNGFAQDMLYKNDGNNEEVKILEVGTRTVIYKKWNNQEGPDFIVAKNDLYKIKFKNGDEVMFNKEKPRTNLSNRWATTRHSNKVYGNNILTISPIHMTNTSATGFGISYERMIGTNNLLSLYLPVCLSFRDEGNNNNYAPISNNSNGRSTMLWVMPGLKFYPTGSNGIVRFGVGPSLTFATGTREIINTVYNPQTNTSTSTSNNLNVFVMGVLINNSLNIQATEHFRIGLELGLGIPYYKNDGAKGYYGSNNSYYNYSSPYTNTPLVQFNFNVGYRF